MPEKLLTAANVNAMKDEAIDMIATAPKKGLAKLERFVSAAADVAATLSVLESRARLERAKKDGQMFMDEIVKPPREELGEDE